MAQFIYLLVDIDTKSCDDIFTNGIYESKNLELTSDILEQMAKSCMVDYFYVITPRKEIFFPNFDFSFKPEEWDKEYMHIWNDDTTVRLFNKVAVLDNPSKFTDTALLNGDIKLKVMPGKIYDYPMFDIIFLSYDETYADANFKKLKERFPRAKRLHNIKGIMEAHKSAARWALSDKSNMFYVVDADAKILPTFNFDYHPPWFDGQSVHVWYSHNPVNDLEYGYGGVKLFPSKLLVEYNGSPIDFTTTVSKNFKVIPEVSNITCFNTDPFSAWRSAFRECTKLASKLIINQDNTETEERLDTWCTKGVDREFGDFVIMGANEGREFGTENTNRTEMLALINDFEWLEKKFQS
jgi:hypothetical protein